MMSWTPNQRKVFPLADHPYALEALMVTREGALLGVMHGELVLFVGQGALAMSVDPDAWAETVVSCYLPRPSFPARPVPMSADNRDNETLDLFE